MAVSFRHLLLLSHPAPRGSNDELQCRLLRIVIGERASPAPLALRFRKKVFIRWRAGVTGVDSRSPISEIIYHWPGLSLSDFGNYLSVSEAARRAPTTRTSRRSAISF